MGLEKTPESPLDCKEIKPVNPKGNQPWIFSGRSDVEAEAPILWPPDVKSHLIGKDPDAGKAWGQEKRVTEDELVGWHHQLSGHECVWANTRRLWRTKEPGVLQSTGSQRIRYDLATEWKHRAAQSAKPHHYPLWFHLTHRQFISNVLVSLDDLLFCRRHQFTATCWHCHDPKWSHHEDHQEGCLMLLVCSFTYSSYMCPYTSLRPSLHWYSSSYSSFGVTFFQTIL